MFRCPISYERAQNTRLHRKLTRAILHIASLAAHTTLNTYNLWKLTLRGHLNRFPFVFYWIFHYATKTKQTNQITECGNKASPRKVIVEWILSVWNDISTIQTSFKSCALTTAIDWDDQFNCFKPEENPFVATLGDIAEATPTEMLIGEDEEGDEEIDVLL